MALSLKKEGILIIDFMNVKKVIKNLIGSETKRVDNITFDIKRSINNKYIIKDIQISENGKRLRFQEKVKALTLTDFSKLIHNAGLKIIDVFGNYKLEEFDASKSERLIIICKK